MKKWIIFFWLCLAALIIWNIYQIHHKTVTIVPLPSNRQIASLIKKRARVEIISYKMTDLSNRYKVEVKLKNTGTVPVANLKFYAQPYFRYQDDPLALGKQPLPRDPRWLLLIGIQMDRLGVGEEASRTVEFQKFSDLIPSGWSDECVPRITFDPVP